MPGVDMNRLRRRNDREHGPIKTFRKHFRKVQATLVTRSVNVSAFQVLIDEIPVEVLTEPLPKFDPLDSTLILRFLLACLRRPVG